MPVLGLILAVTIAIIAYILAPSVAMWIGRGIPVGTLSSPTPEQLLVAGMIWFVGFALAMALVAILVGTDREEKRGIEIRKEMEAKRKASTAAKKKGKR